MNIIDRGGKPQDSVLHVTSGGAAIFFDPETSITLEDRYDMPGLDTIQAIVLEHHPESPDVPLYVRRHIANLVGHIPFFAVYSENGDPAFKSWVTAHSTIFDRRVISRPVPGPPDLPPPLISPPETPLMETVFKDLQMEVAPTFEYRESYTPAGHWEARAQQFGLSGRAVCYANAARATNKMMHAVQIEALEPAIARAAACMRRGAAAPNLLEYGCGIGRLMSYCQPHTTYHGADISRSMIDTARQLNPRGRFFTTRTLGTAAIPEIDIVMTVTVLHHNDRSERRKILKNAAKLAGGRIRLVLLEDLMVPAQIKSRNMYPLSIESLLDDIAMSFGGTCIQDGFQLLHYKPNDLVLRAALIELEIWR